MYDEHYDCIICPEYQVLKYSTTNRDGYKEYKSNPMICRSCPTRELCTKSKVSENSRCQKTVTRHIWQEYIELAEDARYTPSTKNCTRNEKKKLREYLRMQKKSTQ